MSNESERRPLSLAKIEAARKIIDPVFLNSPQVSRTSLDAALDLTLTLKVESLNPIRSFKGRGADFFTAELGGSETLVCASAGNFGQGLAWAGRRRGHPVIVYAAEGANAMKVDAMRRLGAEVILGGEDFDAAKALARAHAQDILGCFVEDGAEPEIAEGAGTIASEMIDDGMTADTVLIPLGNGALAGGMAAVLAAQRPAAQVLAVVAEGAPAMQLSLRQQTPVTTDSVSTIADGIAVREPVPYALGTLASTIDDTLAVSEEAIVEAMALLHEHVGLVVEPAGAVGVAALLQHRARFRGEAVATVLCGGNVEPQQYLDWLTQTPGR